MEVEAQAQICNGTESLGGDDSDDSEPPEVRRDRDTNEYIHNGTEGYEEPEEFECELPLFNDVILNCLMDYVNAQDLPNCRLVCKVWASEAWRQLTKRKCISFQETSMKQFVQFMKIVQIDNIHFSKLQFSHFTVKEYREELIEYFTSAGTFVKEMTLTFVDNELTLEELENVFLFSVPQLEFLALDRLPCDFFATNAKLSGLVVLKKLINLRLNTRCHYNNDEDKSTVFFLDLLRLTPNLKHLHGAVDWCLPRLVTALSIIKLQNLSNLVLKGCFDCHTARTLAMPEFNLKTLYLGTSGFYDLGKNHNIIYSKRHTLRSLGLGWTSFMRRIDLQTLSEDYKELTCLSLCDSSKWSFSASYYAGPGLKRLLADIRMENDFKYLETRFEAFENVRELNLSFVSYQVKKNEIVDRIAILFPALKILTLKITHEFPIARLWTRLNSLEELSIYVHCSSFKIHVNPTWTPYLDEVMTGLGETECEKLRNDAALLNRTELQQNTSLMNLKNLRKLTFYGDKQKISHVTARLCLCKMEFLTAVTLEPVTEACKDVLQSSLFSGTYMDLKY